MLDFSPHELTLRAQREFNEGYRRDRLLKVLAKVERFRTAVDIGAHIGSWTVPLAEKFERVIAFEPSPKNLHYLTNNTKELKNVKIHQIAVSDSNRLVGLIEPKKPISTQVNDAGDIKVHAKTLDSYSLNEVDFLKIHCNGHEEFALRGARQTIIDNKPLVYVTIKINQYVPNDNTDAVLKIMKSIGYKVLNFEKPDWIFIYDKG